MEEKNDQSKRNGTVIKENKKFLAYDGGCRFFLWIEIADEKQLYFYYCYDDVDDDNDEIWVKNVNT